jgi:hypothetical protein
MLKSTSQPAATYLILPLPSKLSVGVSTTMKLISRSVLPFLFAVDVMTKNLLHDAKILFEEGQQGHKVSAIAQKKMDCEAAKAIQELQSVSSLVVIGK